MEPSSHFATNPELSIAQVSRIAGISSRTLRHYDHIGLFTPHHVAVNGYRYYEQRQLVQLQRILLLRDMGLSLESIAQILNEQRDEVEALGEHVKVLEEQRHRLNRQITALNNTIKSLETGVSMNPEESFDGFNEQYKNEITERWGAKAYNDSNRWWRGKNKSEQAEFIAQVKELNSAWITAGKNQVAPESATAQRLAARHVQWLNTAPGTPLASEDPAQRSAYVLALADMYVSDQRFTKNYGGYAELVRDALTLYVQNSAEF
ncbi:MerR family transcriptional regulator [Glutamicibacter sp. JC586]|uniref:MerR family transcriptional regulator n=1 Tax=Glutamicibacter sp. JC586 TaxID=2590552 RepID=UPI001356F80C|nr:MerR family transcriptional regulator [Glutamicibacter sp. JC586]